MPESAACRSARGRTAFLLASVAARASGSFADRPAGGVTNRGIPSGRQADKVARTLDRRSLYSAARGQYFTSPCRRQATKARAALRPVVGAAQGRSTHAGRAASAVKEIDDSAMARAISTMRGADVCRNMPMRVGHECRRTRGPVGRPGRRGRAVFELFGRETAPVFLRAASLAGAVGPPLPVAPVLRLRKRAASCGGRWRPGRSGGRVGNREDANGPAGRRPGRSRREAIVVSGEADRRFARLAGRRPGWRKGARRRRTTAR